MTVLDRVLDPAIQAFVTIQNTLRNQAGRDVTLPLRITTVLAALVVLYMRSPITFTHPQMWGEDAFLFHASRFIGWTSVSIAWAGYLATAQFLVALLASYFNPVYAAAIYCYAAVALTLAVVWFVTSPRLDMPCKPLLAIAVVIVPMGHEELGTLTNIQWILPIGVFALLFMRAAKWSVILWLEVAFTGISSLSGPFSIFFAPLFIWTTLFTRDGLNRRRLIVLTIVDLLGALIQLGVIARHPGAVSQGVSTQYSWMLWVDLPFWQWMSDFGPAIIFKGASCTALALLCLAIAVLLAVRRPYRTQKIFMLLFGVAMAVAGMYKFRAGLATQLGSQRYFYAGSVFALWFICCLAARAALRKLLIGLVVLLELLVLPAVANTPRSPDDTEWPVWAGYISSGLPVIIPTSASGWYLGMPAMPTGPLAPFAGRVGDDVSALPGGISMACTGRLGRLDKIAIHDWSLITGPEAFRLSGLNESDWLWATSGWAWDNAANHQVKLVVLVNAANIVVGFGLPGFRRQDSGAPTRAGWNAVLRTDPGAGMHAYAILQNGARCPLPGQP